MADNLKWVRDCIGEDDEGIEAVAAYLDMIERREQNLPEYDRDLGEYYSWIDNLAHGDMVVCILHDFATYLQQRHLFENLAEPEED